MDSRGYLLIDRPAGVEQVRLRFAVIKRNGGTVTHTIEINFNSGEIRQVPARAGTRAGLDGLGAGTTALAWPPALDLGAQLARAAERTSQADQELLRLLDESA